MDPCWFTEQNGIGLDGPNADEVIGPEVASVFLIRGEYETERPAGTVGNASEGRAGQNHRRTGALHVGRTKSEEPVPLDSRGEGVGSPLAGRIPDRLGIEMAADGQVRPWLGAVDANDQIGPVRLFGQHERRRQAVVVERPLDDFRGRRLVARQVRCRRGHQRRRQRDHLALPLAKPAVGFDDQRPRICPTHVRFAHCPLPAPVPSRPTRQLAHCAPWKGCSEAGAGTRSGRVLVGKLRRRRNRRNDVDQDAIGITGNEMALAKILTAQGQDLLESTLDNHPLILGIDVIDLEVENQPPRRHPELNGHRRVVRIEDRQLVTGCAFLAQTDVPVGYEGRCESEVLAIEIRGRGDILRAENGIEARQLHVHAPRATFHHTDTCDLYAS